MISAGLMSMFLILGLVGGEGYYTGFAFAFQWTTGWPGENK